MSRLVLALLIAAALLYYYLGLLVPVPPVAYETQLVLEGSGTAVQVYTFVGEPTSDLAVDLQTAGTIRLYPPAATRALEYSADGSPSRRVELFPVEVRASRLRARILLDPQAESGTFSLVVNRPLALAVMEVQLPQLRYRVTPEGYGVRHGYAEGLPIVTAYKEEEGSAFIGMEVRAERVPFLLLRYATLAMLVGALIWTVRSRWQGRRSSSGP